MSCEVFNEPSRERTEQLERLKIAIGDNVKAPFWGCTQVCDISKLSGLIHAATALPSYFDLLNSTSLSIPLKWMQRPPRGASSGQSTPSDGHSTPTRTPRPSRPKRLAMERDNGRCVLTGSPEIEVAHIFPYCMINPLKKATNLDNSIPEFWKLLEFFFETERLDTWRRALFTDPADPTRLSDGCHNNICMSSSVHALWTRGIFALRPVEVSNDGTAMTVEFYWQPRPTHGRSDSIDLLEQPGSSKGLNHVDGATLSRLDSNGIPTIIQSGDVFTLKTDDPTTRPLPSFELLDMQWHLNRIVSMTGAADVYDEYIDDDDDDGYISDAGKAESLSDLSDISRLDLDSDTTASTGPSPAKSTQVQNVLPEQHIHVDDAEVSVQGLVESEG